MKLARDDMLLFYAADPRGAVGADLVALQEKLLAALNAATARDCVAAAKTAFAAAPPTCADVALMALRRVES
ncbi:hypothetical protein FACS1894108_16200 [Planctomycetales bacterium]|nr:hypothetical protein FACS1894108_16200 [Planctomycetales bacterium]